MNTLDEMASAARDVGACFDWDNNEDYVPDNDDSDDDDSGCDIWRSAVVVVVVAVDCYSRNDDASIEDCSAYLALRQPDLSCLIYY